MYHAAVKRKKVGVAIRRGAPINSMWVGLERNWRTIMVVDMKPKIAAVLLFVCRFQIGRLNRHCQLIYNPSTPVSLITAWGSNSTGNNALVHTPM